MATAHIFSCQLRNTLTRYPPPPFPPHSTHAHIHVHTYTTRTRTPTCTSIRTHKHVCTHDIYICINAHARTRSHIHIHTQTRAPRPLLLPLPTPPHSPLPPLLRTLSCQRVCASLSPVHRVCLIDLRHGIVHNLARGCALFCHLCAECV